MTQPVLKVENLTTSFRVDGTLSPVVSGVSFEIAPRETLAIVGESGSGKSVTALSIMRLVGGDDGARLDGRILLGGRDLLTLSERDMQAVRGAEVAMIFQEPMTSLNPIMTVGEQLSEAILNHRRVSRREARAEAISLLNKVRIPAAASRYADYPHQMSGGMRQRVMIAMALACRPKLLIADEPTTALDVTVQAQILDLIKALQDEEGMGVLFITHDMGVVAEIADRTVVMYRGEMIEAGDTPTLFAAPREPYTRALLAAVPRLGSMSGEPLPRRFPLVDPVTGETRPAPETRATVDRTVPPVLDVQNLTTRFDVKGGFPRRVTGRVHAVENVSFQLHAGETLSIVGESGCGKSTAGRSILRMVEPAAGSVVTGDVDILTVGPQMLRRQRRDMQMIFQDPFASLDPRLPVGAAIAEPMLVHGVGTAKARAARVTELLERVGLSPAMAERFPHEFSGGQRQRICIARALALRPRFIIADESVSALDVSIKAQVVNLLIDLQEEMGLAFLFISHDMAVVERISHRVAVMYLGEIVEIGPRASVFENPQHPYTQRLIAAVPVPDPARRRMRRPVSDEEIGSPMRPPDHVAPTRTYRQVSPGHLVQEWDEAWQQGGVRHAA
ncbi:glutathione ABC transporter ATP-binding protein GsiA [Acuticoccus sediminis]|uniref:Glutathione import ATP-binding protein GsiA n=1 Tax=Acuticoccus sediminis TaxID=2184697 RepID=A0A8B2NIN5_9HYPH|nr:ABC transporter ATP-binding protein [Acuticoccus sediminis]RAH97381.1 glutathione ABC transporter ATP-binding protein GsiA [Acuticoccus sediminis]